LNKSLGLFTNEPDAGHPTHCHGGMQQGIRSKKVVGEVKDKRVSLQIIYINFVVGVGDLQLRRGNEGKKGTWAKVKKKGPKPKWASLMSAIEGHVPEHFCEYKDM